MPPDRRTPKSVYNQLAGATVGQMATIVGDMVGQGDITADIVARKVALGPKPSATVTMHTRLRGLWESVTDSSETVRFVEGRYFSYYDGNQMDIGRYYFENCLPGNEAGIRVWIEDQPDDYCYDLTSLTWNQLELTAFPRGNLLRYRRAE